MPTRVLLAEDEEVIRLDLKEELEYQGYVVVGETADGESAVALARELRPDLVIMCIRMPIMDGITAAEILTRERIAPVMLVSAMSDDVLVARACDAGVVMYLVKPWRSSEIKPAIETALARHRERLALEDRITQLEESLATRKKVERVKGLLQEKQGLTEQEAFRRVAKLSMKNRKSMREVAEAILLVYSLSDNTPQAASQ
jgi:two-component system, response regulator PdtaR